MSRRDLAASIVGAGLPEPAAHEHDWHTSPFYATVAVTYEEPDFYPPGGSVRLETCDCGLMRLPGGLGRKRGKNLADDGLPGAKP